MMPLMSGVEVQIAMDEICDDGNRLDGDGCSADCLNLDAFVSACEIAVPPQIKGVQDFVFAANGTVLLAARDGLYALSSMVGLPVATRLLAKETAVTAMRVFDEMLWVVADAAVHVLRGGALEKRLDVAPGDSAYLFEDDGRLYLICKDAGHIWLWDVGAATMIASASGNAPPAMSYIHASHVVQVLMQDSVLATVSVAARTVEFMTSRRTQPEDFWEAAMQASFTPFLKMDATPLKSSIKYIPDNNDITAQRINIGERSRVLTPVLFAENLVGPRWLLPQNSSSSSSSMLYVGADALASGDKSNMMAVLNTPLAYDVLRSPSYRDAQPTYFDALSDAMASATSFAYNRSDLWGPALRALTATLERRLSPQLVSRFVENPVTKGIWVLQAGVLKEISRRGVSVERGDQQCIPTCAGLCPACHWSPDCGACVPCPPSSNQLEWQLQCQPCVAAMGLGRRRMLTVAGNNAIAFALAGGDAQAIAAFFAPCSSVSASAMMVTVEIAATADPQAAMRALSAKLLLMPAEWQVVTRPRLLLRYDSAAASSFTLLTSYIIMASAVSWGLHL
jgi:cysteine-rich repeat protein